MVLPTLVEQTVDTGNLQKWILVECGGKSAADRINNTTITTAGAKISVPLDYLYTL